MTEEIARLAGYERMDWVSHCTLTIERLLLIEHYPARAKKLRLLRDKAWPVAGRPALPGMPQSEVTAACQWLVRTHGSRIAHPNGILGLQVPIGARSRDTNRHSSSGG